MKITISILILLTVHVSTLGQSKYNLDFDDFNPDYGELPNGWFKWGDFKNLSGEADSTGNILGKVVSDPNGKFGFITYRIPANYTGDSITLSGLLKYEDVKGQAGIFTRIDGYSKNMLCYKNTYNLGLSGSSNWKRYSISLPLPTNAAQIYVAGTLSGEGMAWFDNFEVTIDGQNIRTLKEITKERLETYSATKLDSAIMKSSRTFDIKNEISLTKGLDNLIQQLGDKRIIAIGESTHGTSEFYKLRSAITKRLIEEKAFKLIILENPYDDLEIMNQNLMTSPLDELITKHFFSIYQTEEIMSFLDWYKDNKSNYNIQFKGCDDSNWTFYDLVESAVPDNRDRETTELLKSLSSNYRRMNKARFKKANQLSAEVYHNIESLEAHLGKTNQLSPSLKEILFNGKTSFINYVSERIVRRDESMALRISHLANNSHDKIIVWAHNAHISKKVIDGQEIGLMGQLLHREFGDKYHSIALMTAGGSYSYMNEKFINGDHNYDDELFSSELGQLEPQTWETIIEYEQPSYCINTNSLKNELGTDQLLGSTRLIGYGKETKDDLYYLPIIQHFDTVILFDKTEATSPLSQ